MRDEDMFLSTKEIAKQLQVGEDTVRRWIRTGQLHAVLLNSKYRVSQNDLKQFLKERRK
jgi:excisionase family DNA binding protein